MLFYAANFRVDHYPELSDTDQVGSAGKQRERHENVQEPLVPAIQNATVRFWERDEELVPFVSEIINRHFYLAMTAAAPIRTDDIMRFVRQLGLHITPWDVHIEEIASTTFCSMIESARYAEFLRPYGS